jgi:histidinol-phosphate aminotransferase
VALSFYTSERTGVSQHILLDANEHYEQWVKIPPSILTNLNRYPSGLAAEFKKNLSQKYCYPFAPKNLFISSGSIEAIDLLIKALKPTGIALNSPTYDVYEHIAQVYEVPVKRIPFLSDGQPNVKELSTLYEKVNMLVLINPNNPTGNLIWPETVTKILNQYRGTVIIDEAYIEYAGLQNSLQHLTLRYTNVIVLRTFSKAWGLAGVRLGYVIARPEVVELLESYQNPYSVNAVAFYSGICALEQRDQLQINVDRVLSSKRQLIKALKEDGIIVKDSAANFITIDIPYYASEIHERLRRQGLLVRLRPIEHAGSDCLRVTIGSPNDIAVFLKAIRETMHD